MIDIIKKINDSTLSPNQYMLLYALHNQVELKNIDFEAEKQELIARGHLDEDGSLRPYDITSLELEEKALEANIRQYQRIFPPISLGTAQIPARGKLSQLRIKVKIFLNTYEYDWSTIYEATTHYVARCEKEKYRYMQNASSFLLDKNGDSSLALECEILQYGGKGNQIEDKTEDWGII